eukprot:753400-Hanusia_phi.AAC.2
MYESIRTSIPLRLKQHNLANHGMLPDKDDMQKRHTDENLEAMEIRRTLRALHPVTVDGA